MPDKHPITSPRRRLLKHNVIILLFALVWTACNTNTVYHTYHSVSYNGWAKGDTLFYAFPVTDTLSGYCVSIELRNEDFYPYQDLYLLVGRPDVADSTIWETDTVYCRLADKKGQWSGSGLGTIYQTSIPYVRLVFPHKGIYTLKILHGMNDQLLRGISDVGIKVEKG